MIVVRFTHTASRINRLGRRLVLDPRTASTFRRSRRLGPRCERVTTTGWGRARARRRRPAVRRLSVGRRILRAAQHRPPEAARREPACAHFGVRSPVGWSPPPRFGRWASRWQLIAPEARPRGRSRRSESRPALPPRCRQPNTVDLGARHAGQSDATVSMFATTARRSAVSRG